MYTTTQLIGACLMVAAVFQVIGMLVGARWEAWRAEKEREAKREKEAFYAAIHSPHSAFYPAPKLDPHDPQYIADEDTETPAFLKRQGE